MESENEKLIDCTKRYITLLIIRGVELVDLNNLCVKDLKNTGIV